MVRDAPILILDEPTTGLDAASARQMLEPLRRLMRGRTVLIISHDLAAIHDADRIAVIDRGRLAELGTHEQLLRQGGEYARLFAGARPDALGETMSPTPTRSPRTPDQSLRERCRERRGPRRRADRARAPQPQRGDGRVRRLGPAPLLPVRRQVAAPGSGGLGPRPRAARAGGPDAARLHPPTHRARVRAVRDAYVDAAARGAVGRDAVAPDRGAAAADPGDRARDPGAADRLGSALRARRRLAAPGPQAVQCDHRRGLREADRLQPRAGPGQPSRRNRDAAVPGARAGRRRRARPGRRHLGPGLGAVRDRDRAGPIRGRRRGRLPAAHRSGAAGAHPAETSRGPGRCDRRLPGDPGGRSALDRRVARSARSVLRDLSP